APDREVVPPPPLHGVRVLILSARPAEEEALTMLLAALGAEVEATRSLAAAAAAARILHPEVLVCDGPFPAAEGLMCELRRGGVVVPALAVAGADDTGGRLASRAAGFSSVLVRPLSLAGLARAVRAVLGA